jgi:hypothetical protein
MTCSKFRWPRKPSFLLVGQSAQGNKRRHRHEDRSGAVLTIRMPVVPEIVVERQPAMAHG